MWFYKQHSIKVCLKSVDGNVTTRTAGVGGRIITEPHFIVEGFADQLLCDGSGSHGSEFED
jgi:hypothetical protein